MITITVYNNNTPIESVSYAGLLGVIRANVHYMRVAISIKGGKNCPVRYFENDEFYFREQTFSNGSIAVVALFQKPKGV